MENNKKKYLYIILALVGVIAVLGISYAWFSYRGETSEQELIAGDLYVTLANGQEEISLTNVFPESTTEARAKNDNFITFEITGLNESGKTIYYEFDLNHGTDKDSPKIRFNDSDLKFDLVELDSNDDEIRYLLNAVSYDTLVNKRIYVDTVDANTTVEVSRKYKLRMWLSDDVIISDTDPNATYPATGFNNYYGNIKLTVIGDFNEKYFGYQKVQKAILAKQNASTNSCNPVWTDTEDGIVYFSGTNDCVDMNYVWYSGKLWRITAIYPDGAMKLVTQDNLTTISYGATSNFDGSWAYQWLNENFYDTLVNPSNIVDENAIWNYSIDDGNTPVRPETIEIQSTKVAPVGLINYYEVYNSYRNASFSTGFYQNSYSSWVITPNSNSMVYTYGGSGASFGRSSTIYMNLNIRPAIVIKSGLELTGEGTKTNPYKIVGDKELPVNNATLLSSRSIGEYVKFDNDIYRIVEIDSGITKLTMVDYLRDESNSNEIITKYFASSIYYGKNSNTGSDDYWDYYLNNTWYNGISSSYKNMMVDGTYYLGFSFGPNNYKGTICKDENLDIVTTDNCTKYTVNDTDKTWTGKVGLPRIGEIFTSQLVDNRSSAVTIWLISPNDSTSVNYITSLSSKNSASPSSVEYAVRPSIYLKSGIKITGGTGYVGGETNSPFEISE